MLRSYGRIIGLVVLTLFLKLHFIVIDIHSHYGSFQSFTYSVSFEYFALVLYCLFTDDTTEWGKLATELLNEHSADR